MTSLNMARQVPSLWRSAALSICKNARPSPSKSPLLKSPTAALPRRCPSSAQPLNSPISIRHYATQGDLYSSPISSSSTPQASTAAAMYAQRQRDAYKRRNQSLAMYTLAVVIFGVGFTYASVPLYRAFCSATGFGGTPMVGQGRFEPSRLIPADPSAKKIRVTFNADCSDELPWSFQRSQDEIHVIPGETSLAFFTAHNRSKKDIIGIATYNVAPDRIAPYFSKVECFCFEQQKLLAGEEVDLPVFFFIDNDYLDDPNCRDVQDVVLSYTFFAARRNQKTGDLEPDTDLESVSHAGRANHLALELTQCPSSHLTVFSRTRPPRRQIGRHHVVSHALLGIHPCIIVY